MQDRWREENLASSKIGRFKLGVKKKRTCNTTKSNCEKLSY